MLQALKSLYTLHAAFAVCLGASVGALTRWQLGLWLNHPGAWLPWGTLAANLIGGYVIGVLAGVFLIHPDINPLWRLLLVTGLMGGLTTFSSFSAEVVEMLVEQRWSTALSSMLLHVGGSFALTYLGLRSARAVLPCVHG
ncbi:MAG: fluoride efflux transporter CrcB [Burkholderiaceae bacterium]|jgi:CrcB protein|nr:fluoride efflux transporter CrcB [Burkholderiaceae bacterium]